MTIEIEENKTDDEQQKHLQEDKLSKARRLFLADNEIAHIHGVKNIHNIPLPDNIPFPKNNKSRIKDEKEADKIRDSLEIIHKN